MRRRGGAISLALQTVLIALIVLTTLLGFKGLFLIVNALDWFTLLLCTAAALALSLMLAWWDQL